MKIENGDFLTLNTEKNEQYLVIDIILFEGVKYIFTNKFVDEKPTEDYAIYEFITNEDDETSDGNIRLINDNAKIELLFPMFNNNVKKILQELNKERFNIE